MAKQDSIIWVIRDKGLPRAIGLNPESLQDKLHSNPKFLGRNI